jgi:hypothetical protein
MRAFLMATIVGTCVLAACSANAESPGQISDAQLAQIGMAGLQPMSDVQGDQIRGMGFSSGGVKCEGSSCCKTQAPCQRQCCASKCQSSCCASSCCSSVARYCVAVACCSSSARPK